MSERILVVEDQRIVARDLATTLEALGYVVSAIAGTADEAVRHADAFRPDVVLMDIELGDGADGIEAARSIRERHDVTVIFLTAHSDTGTLARAKSVEPGGFLVKPVSPDQLRSVVELAVAKHAMDRRLKLSKLDLDRERDRAARIAAQLAIVVANVGFGIAVTDPAGVIVLVNQPLLDRFDVAKKPAELVGRRLAETLPTATAEVTPVLVAGREAGHVWCFRKPPG